MMKICMTAVAMTLLVAPVANAQTYTTHKVRDLSGWQCMALASAYEPDGINAPPAPVYAGPAASAPRIGGGAGVIIVQSPMHTENGRTVIIRPNGKEAWIDVAVLTRWHALSNPNASCHPALLSNGRYGFKTTG